LDLKWLNGENMKKPVLSDVTNILTSASTINDNNAKIEEAFDNTLSLDGSVPNAMKADLDMNGNTILNANGLDVASLKVGGVTVVPNGLTQTDADIRLGTVNNMKAMSSLKPGDKVTTLGYDVENDGGGSNYTISTVALFGTPNDYGDHLLNNGYVAVRDKNSVFKTACYGINNSRESSARFNAVNADALAYKALAGFPTLILFEGKTTIKDGVTLGSSGVEDFNITFSNGFVTAVSGGNLSDTVPMFTILVSRSEVRLCRLEASKITSGWWLKAVGLSRVYDPFCAHYISTVNGYAVRWGENGSGGGLSEVYGAGGYEWSTDDVVAFNNPSSWFGKTFYTDCIDGQMFGGRIGYGSIGIYQSQYAANIHYHGVHPFQGNPRVGESGQLPVANPVIVKSDATKSTHWHNCYLDNGLFLDPLFKCCVNDSFFLRIADRIGVSNPMYRVGKNDSLLDDRAVIRNLRGRIGFYSDTALTTPDPDYQWVVDNNDSYFGEVGTSVDMAHRFCTIISGGSANPDFDIFKQGTSRVSYRYVTNNGIGGTILQEFGGLAMRTNASVLVNGPTSKIGYDVGAGETITQTTSRSTNVTGTRTSGRISLVPVGSAPTTSYTQFTFTNVNIEPADTISITQYGGASNVYEILTYILPGGGSCVITFRAVISNNSDAVSFNYQIIKGSVS
jgi:hypothetical protein